MTAWGKAASVSDCNNPVVKTGLIGLTRYLSVAWLRDEDYWRDAPGRHSIQLNYELLQRGLRIGRTLILNDFYWPPAASLPAKSICAWIEEQHKRGIAMRLVRDAGINISARRIWRDRARLQTPA